MPNQYRNKVVYYGETLMDLTADTVTPETLLEGYTAHDKSGAPIVGTLSPSGGEAVVVTEEEDEHGGIIKIITAVDLSNDTVTAAHLERGYTAHDRQGNAITGTLSPGGGGSMQSKSVSYTPSETAQSETVSPDAGYDGLSSVAVSVGAVSSTYVGSGITRRSSSDMTASGNTVTAPAGYYASNGTKSVANGTVTAPSSISGASATVSTGTNTLTLTKTVSVTPSVTTAGYVSSGTAGNSSVSLTASVTTKAATTYNTSSSNQTIASGTYITGTQTIRAVTTSGISAANIKSGVTVNVGDAGDADRIVGVTGTFTSDATAAAGDIVSGETAYVNGSKITGSLVIQHYYTGTTTPASSLGVNGDIYLKTS